MDSSDWERIQALFHEAAGLPASQRMSYLREACGSDEHLMAAVAAMLEEDTKGSTLLDSHLGQIAEQMLDASGVTSTPAPEFGPYRVRKVLGEGGMGIVFLAERDDLGSQVAVKVLRDAWMSPARRERFAAEQRVLAQLTHPFIARLYDADTLRDGTPWFAMEYVNGRSLTDYCSGQSSSIEEKLRLYRCVCEAVQYAHSRAIIHRDLKPSNVLARPDGVVKLLDFGIAKHLEQPDSPADQTRTGLRLMTPAYAAPEQIRGEPVGVYTDVYSLGVILYELLGGEPPFNLKGSAPSEAETLVLREEPEKLSVRARRRTAEGAARAQGHVSWADLDVLCLTAMQKAPERRYRSVEALIRDIDHYLKGEPLEARGDSFRYRAGKFLRRNLRAAAAVAFTLATIAMLVSYYSWKLSASRRAELAEAARTERVLRFTLNLFSGGDKEAGPAKDLRVTALVDRGIQEAGSLDHDPAVQAELYQTLGEVSQKLGDLGRADWLLDSALERRKALLGPNHPDVAESEVRLGLLKAEQAKLGEAERLVREGLEISKRSLPPGHPGVASATHALGRVLEEKGSYAEAILVLEDAVRQRSLPGADQADLSESLLELANAQFYAGHFAEAEALNQRLLIMHRRLYGDRHPLVAEDLVNLGAIQQELGHYPPAEQFHRQALEITEAFYGKEHHKTASNLTLIARALVKQNRLDEAVLLLQRALAIQEAVFGKVHPRVASVVNELGSVALARNNYAEAEADFRRMGDIYTTVYAGKHYLIGIAKANIGSVLMARKDYVAAEQMYRQALAMYALTLQPGSLNEAITRIKLGRVLLRQNRLVEAEPESKAGYEILASQANPSVTWLQQARTDLAEIHTGLKQPGKAAQAGSLTPLP
jgi:eukaryotic-like serine/threonine-protein kinase